MTTKLYCSHVSVDCVVFGFDGKQLTVLLVERMMDDGHRVDNDMKLPGSLIYQHEDPDNAALRVLYELTGLKNIYLKQFHSFGSTTRTDDPKDMHWLQRTMHEKIERIITVAYMSLIRIDRRIKENFPGYRAKWMPLTQLPQLAFDHNIIVMEAIKRVRQNAKFSPAMLFELLPPKFTATELRTLYEAVYNEKLDVRNFNKKLLTMDYVVRLEETQQHVPHRAARYYKFNKKVYNKQFKSQIKA